MKKNEFMEGAIIATFAIIISKIMGVLYVIPFYRIIGEQGGALYGYAYNIYNIFLIISSAGIPLAISKITSEYETKGEIDKKVAMYKMSKIIVYIFSILSFLTCFLLSKQIAALIIGDLSGGNTISDVSYVIKCVSFALLVVPILSISRGYLQGHKYITASSFSQVIEQIVRIAVILLGSFIALKVLKLPLTLAVGVSVFSACIGAIIAYIYLFIKLKKIKSDNTKVITKKTKIDVIKKIIGYSIPFIIMNISNSLYNTTDMILLIRGLNNIGYSANDIETISSVFTTWGAKLISIVTAFATGLVISLIPSIVSSYVKKEKENVNYYFNKTLEVLLIIILPITIFMSIFSTQIWSIFYGKSFYGPVIFKYAILVAFLDSAYLLICSALQGINKTKLVYFSVIGGLLINLILDLPFMYVFNNLGIYPFYGAITATVLGYSFSLGVPLIYLSKKENFNYKSTLKLLPKLIICLIIVISISLLYKCFIPYKNTFICNIIYLLFIGLIYVGVYFALNKRRILSALKDKKISHK